MILDRMARLRASRNKWRAQAERLEASPITASEIRLGRAEAEIASLKRQLEDSTKEEARRFMRGLMHTSLLSMKYMGERVEDIYAERELLRTENRMLYRRARCGKPVRDKGCCSLELGHVGGFCGVFP